ncbi:MAG: multifunctional CCA addition/repair protein [Gammaproteobacteria bacterium]|nr:multifunctional CCA addition/repair protein [Gammaproteobacteria bacterium]
MEVYLVGGAVRDELLGREPKEFDWVVVGSTVEEMLDQGYLQVGKDFPVFLHPQTKDEYALARTERKSGHGYGGFEVHADPSVTLEEDLLRRDLTVNAIAKSDEGKFFDPFNGRKDLEAKLLRHVSSAFVEDPLRVLRVSRFAARYAQLGFTIADETMQLMSSIVDSGELAHLTPERVWMETLKALSEDKPSVYFESLRKCGALAVIFPEIDKLFGVPQRKDFHPEVDTGIHTMMVVDQSARFSADPVVRFAALLHDLGKAETPAEMLPRHHGHEARGVKPVRALCSRLRVPNAFRDMALIVAQKHGLSLTAFELKPVTIVELFESMDAYRRPERVEQFILASKSDFHGRPGYEDQEYPQSDYLRAAYAVSKNISSAEFLESGLAGKEVGAAIRRARSQAISKLKLEFDLPKKQE